MSQKRRCAKNCLYFDITIKDGDRTAGKVQRTRAAVSLQKFLVALN
jgi:hypothetical protein